MDPLPDGEPPHDECAPASRQQVDERRQQMHLHREPAIRRLYPVAAAGSPDLVREPLLRFAVPHVLNN